ncbi:MAG: hypothetical protein WBE28_08025 [bacterium]
MHAWLRQNDGFAYTNGQVDLRPPIINFVRLMCREFHIIDLRIRIFALNIVKIQPDVTVASIYTQAPYTRKFGTVYNPEVYSDADRRFL